jgi:class 3 adenylate cyclase
MGLKDELTTEVGTIFRSAWTTREGDKVPESADVKLGNDGVKLTATVLYADLRESTGLVNRESAQFAAEIYKAFLHCAYRIIKTQGGVVTAYDGDRIMAVFIGGYKNTSAVKTAMKINDAMVEVVNPTLKAVYTTTTISVKHRVGIDTSDLLVARTGVRGNNDLVWVGRAANYAAKLAAIQGDYATYITSAVYDQLNNEAKVHSRTGANMWTQLTWSGLDGTPSTIYASSIRWVID